MFRGRRSLFRDETGVVGPAYAVGILALVAIAGVGFDYGRMVSLDSELQNAADQAALAGATQLDGKSGACARAFNAVADPVNRFVLNHSRISNDGGGSPITFPQNETACDATGSIRFWQDKNKVTAAATDADAHFIEVLVNPRAVNYALTPLVGAFSSGLMNAAAMAGIGSSICKVPPVMICNPYEDTDPDFAGNYTGDGVRLIANDGGANYAPGNFGYLETNSGNGAIDTARTLGRVEVPGDCVAEDGVTTKPGVQISVLDALNARFDIYANGLNNVCGNDNSLCPPSANTRKDVMKSGNGCAFSPGVGGNGWKIPAAPYLPPNDAPLTSAQLVGLSPMGYPRDMCHAGPTLTCGRIGDGNWDRNAYFTTNSLNYPMVPTSDDMISMFGTASPTRYEVYKYEASHAATRLQTQPASGNPAAHGEPVCVTPGVPVDSTEPDRRVLSVAVINCETEEVAGRAVDVHVTRWIDVFLVEPSLPRARTEASDVYVEVIGETKLGGGGTLTPQLIRRDVPYLVQ